MSFNYKPGYIYVEKAEKKVVTLDNFPGIRIISWDEKSHNFEDASDLESVQDSYYPVSVWFVSALLYNILTS